MQPRRDGLFTKGEHPTPEMREKIRAGVIRHWQKRQRPDPRLDAVREWVRKERAKIRESK
jgi:hypothetical protein